MHWRGLAWLLVGLGTVAACVGDNPSTNDPGSSDGGSNPGRDGGSGGLGDGSPDDDAPFSLTLQPAAAVLTAAAPAHVTITVTRRSYQGALKVSLTGLPSGITAPDVAVAPGATSQQLVITASAAALAGESSASVVASATDGSHDVVVPLSLQVRGAPGTLDTSFGAQGIARYQPSGRFATGNALVVDPAGGVYVGGHWREQLATPSTRLAMFARLTAAGQLDATFGGGPGGAGFALRFDDGFVNDVALDSVGRLVAVGASGYSGAEHANAYRLDANGAADVGFGDAGTGGGQIVVPDEMMDAHHDVPFGNARLAALQVLPDDSIAAVGVTIDLESSQYPALAQFSAGSVIGVIPNTNVGGSTSLTLFPGGLLVAGGDGATGAEIALPVTAASTRTEIASLTGAYQVITLASGKFLFATSDGKVTRLDAQRAVDGISGVATGCTCNRPVEQADGSYVLGGGALGGSPKPALTRLSVDGTLDPTFGNAGLTLAEVPGYVIVDLQTAPGGKLVALAHPLDALDPSPSVVVLRFWQ